MALADRPVTAPPLVKGPTCTVTRLLSTLPPRDADWLRERLADGLWSHADLSRVLRDEGHPIEQQTLARHRRGECKCER